MVLVVEGAAVPVVESVRAGVTTPGAGPFTAPGTSPPAWPPSPAVERPDDRGRRPHGYAHHRPPYLPSRAPWSPGVPVQSRPGRPDDLAPQVHTHCLVPNLVRRKTDGRYVALDASPLFDWCRAAGSVYQAHLQRSLSLRLGVAWGPDHHNTREAIGFSREQLRAFSKRSAQIEAELEAKGALYESPGLRMQSDDEASLATRTRKDHSLTPTLLQGRWRDEAAAVVLATGTELEEAVCWNEPAPEAPGWDDIAATLVDPEVGLCSRSARFTASDVVEHVCAISGGRLSVEEVVTMADRFLASELVVRLTPDVEEGRRRAPQWSTAAHRAMEDRALALMGALTGRHVPAIEGAVLDTVLAGVPALGEDQVAAVKVLAGEGGALRAVLAPAGYGKTTMLHAAAQGAAADGRPVVAVATTAKAVAELAGAGLDSKDDRPAAGRPGRWAAGRGHRRRPGRGLPDPDARGRSRPGRGRRLPGRLGMGVGRPPPVPARRRRRDGRLRRAPRY